MPDRSLDSLLNVATKKLIRAGQTTGWIRNIITNGILGTDNRLTVRSHRSGQEMPLCRIDLVLQLPQAGQRVFPIGGMKKPQNSQILV
jgi:hypothetical protein